MEIFEFFVNCPLHPSRYVSILPDKLEFVGQIFTAPLPPAFMRGVPEGRGEYRTRMRKSFYLRRFALILG